MGDNKRGRKSSADASENTSAEARKKPRRSRFSETRVPPDSSAPIPPVNGAQRGSSVQNAAQSATAAAAAAAARAAAIALGAGAKPPVPPGGLSEDYRLKQEKALAIQRMIQQQLSALPQAQANVAAAGRGGGFPEAHLDGSSEPGAKRARFMPAPLLLDKEGRQVDAEGNVIKEVVRPVATLKANLASTSSGKAAVNPYLAHLSVDKSDKASAFDPRLKVKSRETRASKSFSFVKEGTYTKLADKMRMKEAEKVRAGFASGRNPNAYKKEGITNLDGELEEEGDDRSETRNPLEEDDDEAEDARNILAELPPLPRPESSPDVEWWDIPFLPKNLREKVRGKTTGPLAAASKNVLKLVPEKVATASAAGTSGKPSDSASDTSGAMDDENTFSLADLRVENSKEWEYVQHPTPAKKLVPERDQPKTLPLYLTKKERKRIRRQNRAEREKEKQEKVALGLIPPPPPKVKLSNMMRVLGEQAVADPSMIEAKVREQVAQRQRNHELRNLARKLTPEEKKEKSRRKKMEDLAKGLHVALFRVTDLSDPQHRFKVDINAQENGLTGGVLICKDAGLNLVVVEGGPKAIRKFIKLMTRRIDWAKKTYDEEEDEEEDEMDEELQDVKRCDLVWQGEVAKRAFTTFRFQECRTASTARKVMEAKGVVHYWDMVYKFTETSSATDW